MATLNDEWHLAAARVSPVIWEVQKAQKWSADRARQRLRQLSNLRRMEDYVGILDSEPEMTSLRDRLVITPINYPIEIYKHPFLVERERRVEVYDWSGDLEFEGEMRPEQHADFIKWCTGFFVRLVGLRPPIHGP